MAFELPSSSRTEPYLLFEGKAAPLGTKKVEKLMNDHAPAPVSCVITSYNNRNTIGPAIMSVLNQTLPVAEILIADDASTDGTQALLVKATRKYPSLRLILRQKNLGIAANRDLATREVSQSFVTHLDGDDLFAPRKIEAEWTALAGAKDQVAFSRIANIDPQRFWRSRLKNPERTVSGSSEDIIAQLLMRCGAIPRDMLLSLDLYHAVGGFCHAAKLYEDWEFKLKLASIAKSWKSSGELGTLYIQNKKSLSKADFSQHKIEMSAVFTRFSEYLENKRISYDSNYLYITSRGNLIKLNRKKRFYNSLKNNTIESYRVILNLRVIKRTILECYRDSADFNI